MADQVIGRAVLEIVTDGTKFSVGVAEAKDQSRAFVAQLKKDGEIAGGAFSKLNSSLEALGLSFRTLTLAGAGAGLYALGLLVALLAWIAGIVAALGIHHGLAR